MEAPRDLLLAFRDGCYRATGPTGSLDAGCLLAVSGGVDSVVLLDLAVSAPDLFPGGLVAGHVDHSLRPGSQEDAAFVRGLAEARGIPFVERRLSLGARASEAKARAGRRTALREMAEAADCSWIMLAHHGDDQAETVLFRLLRGSAARGGGAMRYRDGPWLRPLLGLRRRDVEAYARARGLPWREDETNRSLQFTRNRLRHEVLPLAAEIVPGAEDALIRLGEVLDGERAARELVVDLLLDSLGISRLEGGLETGRSQDNAPPVVEIDLGLLPARLRAALPLALPELLRRVARDEPVELSRRNYESFAAVCARSAGTEVLRLPGGVRLERRYDTLVVAIAPRELREELFGGDCVLIPGPGAWQHVMGVLHVEARDPSTVGATQDPWTTWISREQAPFPWRLRGRAPGDRFTLPGEAGSKRVSRLLVDRKIPRALRADWPLLEIGGVLAWVLGLRRTEHAFPAFNDGETEAWLCRFERHPS